MKPVADIVFVKEASYEMKKNQFEYAGSQPKDYIVTAVGPDVTRCKVGDFVLFDDYREYEFRGKSIFKVNESDIHGVQSA